MQFGVCVFDGDPAGGLAAIGLPPAGLFGDRSLAEVLRRGRAIGEIRHSLTDEPDVAALAARIALPAR